MVNNSDRPPPEQFLALIRQQQRGRLKLYLGFAAGVGKTYEMLLEGNRLQRQGVHVVVGILETHGRAETAAQVGDLDVMPRRKIEYKGVTLEEMDVDAMLERHPTVALVDELAHTNAPGSRNAKRYQDVEELLRAGINVIATLNVQHLESVYDLVEQATGVKVKERLPDYVLAMADQIVNVDVSAEDLRERLQAGKIYPQERIERALTNFFTAPNLTRLRELTLSEIAHQLDRRRRAQSGDQTQGGSERVMVCLSSRSPNTAALLRKGGRLADRMGVSWYAVYVRTPSEQIERIDAATQRYLANNLELAQKLGAVTMKINADDFIGGVQTFVEEYEITHILLGRSQRPWYRRWIGPSVYDRLLQVVPKVDVLIVGNTPVRAAAE